MRKRTLIILLLPILIIMWTIGWAFLWKEDQQKFNENQHRNTEPGKGNEPIVVQVPEQEIVE